MTHVQRQRRLSRLWHHGPAAAVAVGVGVLSMILAVGADDRGPLFAVALVQASLVLAWPSALRYRGYVGAVLIGGGAAAAADVVAVRAGDRLEAASANAGAEGLGPIAAVLALAVILAFVHQITRRPPRLEVTTSLGGVVLLAAVAVAPSSYLVLAATPDGPELMRGALAAVTAAVVVGHLVDLVLPYPRLVEGVPRGALGFLVGTAAAVVALAYVGRYGEADLVERLGATILGAVLGAVAALMAIAASYAVEERPGWAPAQTVVQAVFPFAAAAPVAYVVTILVRG